MSANFGKFSLSLPLVAAFVFSPAVSAVTIDWTPVGDPGNACETQVDGCFGGVPNAYKIGTYEVTNSQYAEFLNAVAATDTNFLYSPSMGLAFGGITQSGLPGSFSYSVTAGRGNMPVNFVSFYDSVRFANWLHNGQPTGAQGPTTTEGGAYTFFGPFSGPRNPLATIFLPSEDEWYKAAYYNAVSTSYFDYPALSDTPTTCTAPTAAANSANCDAPGPAVTDADVDDVTNVGSFTGSAGPYGTFDQGGNVYEWTEAVDLTGFFRVVRGGSFTNNQGILAASTRPAGNPFSEVNNTGFRVAMVPEPGTGLLMMTGLLGLAWGGRRRT